MLFGDRKKLEEKVSSTLYDLTHLEINTIIKDEMTATKAPNSPRLLLNALATTYYNKLVSLGNKYQEYLGPPPKGVANLFRGEETFLGSGYESFHELSHRAESAGLLITDHKVNIPLQVNEIDADIMMLKRIETISNDIRCLLKMTDTAKGEPLRIETKAGEPPKFRDTYKFDSEKMVNDFRTMKSKEASDYELDLDLRQLMVIKKANDIGTERVILQTVIGMDGDVTTRISKSFAENPITFINNMHHEGIDLSVKFWKSLIDVVVQLGTQIIGYIKPK